MTHTLFVAQHGHFVASLLNHAAFGVGGVKLKTIGIFVGQYGTYSHLPKCFLLMRPLAG